MKQGRFTSGNSTAATFSTSHTLAAGLPTKRAGAEYDAKWAYALSVISGWSYANGQVLADQVQYYGFPRCTVEQVSVENDALFVLATAFFISSEDRRVGVLAFRGTVPTSLISWLTDADTAKYAFGGGYVHSGFYANAEAIWRDLFDVIGAAIAAGLEELYITGHSLGGAMAVLTASRIYGDAALSDWQKRIRGIYTFGQPIVGDEGFKADNEPRFGRILFRHVYADDVVACVPPSEVDPTFVHFGEKRIAAKRDDTWHLSRDPDRRATLLGLLTVVESFFTRRIEALRGLPVPYSIDDHSPRGYIDVSRNSVVPEGRRAAVLARSVLPGLDYWRARVSMAATRFTFRQRAPG